MLRLLSVAFALIAFGSATAQADGTRYRDPEGRFNLTVPTGWLAEKPVEPKIALLMASPRVAEIGGICIVMVTPVPDTKSATQAELDATFSEIFTREFWTAAYQASGLKEVTIESTGAKDQSGHKVYFVVASATVEGEKGSLKAKSKQVLHAIPGSFQFVNCTAKFESYAQLETEFESIFDSYDAKKGDFIVRAPQNAPSVLALYSGPRFDGITRVVSQDTPNLPMLGWTGATASVAVQGYGQWEVCDGLNYAGNCRLFLAATQGERGMRIGSVRRYIDARDPRGAASLVSATAGEAVKTSSERIAR